ncbi:universal stress protein [Granulicella sp. L46]|jgi:nucleotide-binding universal stress UspA family protein|uniref:universal stress protein n=1 Tax=Granulicella sp. L46 TaxID=1641865 RepID=UPI00131BE277|nr:universal stress protein [Granulicella sp. L46]
MLAKPKMDRILFATDFLSSSRLALDYAVAFARHFEATVIMVHALELSNPAREAETETSLPSLTRRHADERLHALAHGVRNAGVTVEAFIEDGIPAEVITRAADRHSADLLVLGVHGVHRGLSHLLVGSNTEKILLSTSCPTMTVGAHVFTGVDPDLHFKEILYFTDFTPEAAAAAPYAAFLGRSFHAPVDVCQLLTDNVPTDPAFWQEFSKEYEGAIRQAHPELDTHREIATFDVGRGVEFEEIIDRARVQQAGLIVLGAHAESQLARHLHTSFAYQLLSRATCPVISIRPAPAEAS